jgi:DNA-binding protein YbaB
MLGGTVVDQAEFTDQLRARSAELRRRAEALRADLAKVSESVTSPDRLVTVTVGAGGVMREIKVESAGQRANPTQWADAVMRAYAQGCRVVGEKAAALVEQHTPGTPAAQLMREAVPPPPEGEQD